MLKVRRSVSFIVGVGVGESATESGHAPWENAALVFCRCGTCFESSHVSCVTVGREHGFSVHAYAHAHETDGPRTFSQEYGCIRIKHRYSTRQQFSSGEFHASDVRDPLACLLACAWVNSASATEKQSAPTPENTKQACTDGIDNDEDGHVDCDDQDCQDYFFCAKAKSIDSPSVDRPTRAQAKHEIVVGSVLLSFGGTALVLSAAPWVLLGASPAGLGVGISMDVIGLGLAIGGTVLVVQGVEHQDQLQHGRAMLFTPTFSLTKGGAQVGLVLRF